MFGSQKILYTLKKYTRSKSIKIKINTLGNILVTAPKHINKKQIDILIKKESKWISTKQHYFKSLPQPSIKKNNTEYKEHKIQAKNKIEELVKKVNEYYMYEYDSIHIRNQKTRWGSCSSKKNLNFNYKIFFLPEDLAEYIITHELCHLAEMNHGVKFWKLIEETIPDYKERHQKLRAFRL